MIERVHYDINKTKFMREIYKYNFEFHVEFKASTANKSLFEEF
jgi:hypothetical protein